ncbi:MAG: hypothetical protein M3Y29_08690 [Chloroflexota bacterium]|nr:hypothetical protein [Chloroflexota bacterium]
MSRRAVGSLLVAYGVFGLALTIIGMLVGLELAGRVERLSGSAGGTLEAAADATRAAADSFASVDTSLTEAQSSADGAADLARDASLTLDALSAAMNITILGSQPLQPLSAQFATSADQAEQLAGTLESVASSLSNTRTDAASIGTELGILASELGTLESSMGIGSDPPPLRLFAVLLLAWIGIQAIAILAYGVSLLRPPRVSA